MNKIDIVIVTYKSYGYLERCISSIYEDSSSQGFIQDIIVVDNAPSDTYWDSRPRIFDNVVVLRSEKNLGFAQAVNLGIKKCSAAYILLLNPDTIVHGNMIARSVAFMDQHPSVGIMGPRILNRDGSVQGSARGFPTPFTGLFGRSTLLTKWFPKNPLTRRNVLTTKSDGMSPMEVDWVSGACMVVRRKALDDVGHMDERFFMYWEDADWCRRMWQNRWKVIYFPRAAVVHYVGVSSGKRPIRCTVEFHKSCYRLFEKYKKPSFRFVKPLAIGGVALRLCLVLFSNGIRVWSESFQSLMKPREAPLAVEDRGKIKVLRIIARLNIGGPSIHVAMLTQGLEKNRFQSTLVAGRVSSQEGDMSYLFGDFDEKPIMIPELQREPRFIKDLKSLFQVLRIMSREKPDIVDTHTAKAGAIGRIAVFLHKLIHRRNVRVVHTFHGHVFRGYFGKPRSLFFLWVERLLAKITDVIIAISESQKSELSSKYRIAPTRKFRVVPLGFDLAPFLTCKAETYQKSEVRSQRTEHRGQRAEDSRGQVVEWSSGRVVERRRPLSSKIALPEWKIGIVGRLVAIKNHKMFLESAKIFLDHNPDIPARFLIIGDGELRNDLVKCCEQQGVSPYVKFCGWQTDLAKVYADLDIVALTSINEGTPVSIIEAMASSVPVICTDAGGVRDLLGAPVQRVASNGCQVHERGILCQQGDVEGFAMGLKYLVENHSRLKKEMSGRARLFVEQSFSKERLFQDIESLYLELMGLQITRT
jgi:GT2 family glycosyltransferase/glycosyltransferase involved in cell wall biosynthesis